MTLPSLNLLLQSILSGIFIGGLYGLIGLGLGLTWGLLRQINLSHFGLVFLGGYLSYQMAASWHLDPLLALLVVPPAFFLVGVGMQWLLSRFAITPFNSLLVTFGITVMIESLIQGIWTADYRRLESHYNGMKFTVGSLYVPVPELVTFLLALAISFGIWAGMRYTDLGKALRAMAEDGPIASAYGIDSKRMALVLAGGCAALAGVAGVCLALVVGVYRLLFNPSGGYAGVLNLSAAALLIAAVVMSPGLQRLFQCRLSRFLGAISFPLYLSHVVVICSLGSWLALEMHDAGYSHDTLYVVVLVTCIVASLVLASLLWPIEDVAIGTGRWFSTAVLNGGWTSGVAVFGRPRPPRRPELPAGDAS